MRLVRIEYWNPSTGTVRTGATGHGESLADMETYLLPLNAELAASALGSGVVDGLGVSATVGTQGLTVSTGLAVDGKGRPVLLSEDGAVVVDPNAPPVDQVQNVPLDLVGSGGTELATSGLTGAQVLTLTAREALDPTAGASSWSLVHAPWLRLVAQATFTDDGSSVPLALVTLDATGAVTALDAGPRRQASPTVGSLTLLRTAVVGGQTPSVGAGAGPTLRTRQDGGLDVMLPGPPAGAALSVEGTTGNLLARGSVGIGTGTDPLAQALHVTGSMHSGGADAGLSFMDRHVSGYVDAPTTGQRWVWYADGGYAHLWSGADQLAVGRPGDGGGLDVPRRMRVRQGTDASAGVWFSQRAAPDAAFVGMADDGHVGLWGQGVGWGLTMDTSSGAASTFAELSVGTGKRANLRVSGDATVGSGGNGVLTTRHVNGKLPGNDGPDDLYLNWATGKGVHVGGAAAATLAVHGPAVVDANLTAGGIVESFQYRTNGQSWLRGQVYTGELFGHWDGKATMRLFGSSLYDLGDGWLQVESGGGRTYLRGEVTVQGALHKPGGGFRIDHPLAPEEKYLSHSFVESPEMANLYNGIAVTDENGQAQVLLPDYFEVLNRDHRFQLTTIGQLAMATVEGEVRDNAFTIRTDKPGVTVSWQVTGVRQDLWAEAHPITVEEDKPAQENGSFLHPELFGQQPDRAFLAAAPSKPGNHTATPALQPPPAPPLSGPPQPEGPTG